MEQFKSDNAQIERIISQLVEVLKGYETFDKNLDIHEFIKNELKKSALYNSDLDINRTTFKIQNTVKEIEGEAAHLEDSKDKKGLDTKGWLKLKLDLLARKLSNEKERQKFTEVTDSLIDQILNKDRRKANSDSPGIVDAITMSLKGDLLKSLKDNQGLKVIKQFLKADFSDSKQRDFIEVVATSLEISRKRDKKLSKIITTEEATAIASQSAYSTKVAYKFGKGEILLADAYDKIFDRSVATLQVLANTICMKYATNVGARLGAAVGALFSPLGLAIGAVVGSIIGTMGGKVVGDIISKGIKKVGEYAKEYIFEPMKEILEKTRKVIDFILS
jgi:hypothetical protein